MLTKGQLAQLRKEICLNSLFLDDYENSLGIDKRTVCAFFEGYTEYLEDLMQDEVEDFDDGDFFDWLGKYDNTENLWGYYNLYAEDPLPIKEETEEEE